MPRRRGGGRRWSKVAGMEMWALGIGEAVTVCAVAWRAFWPVVVCAGVAACERGGPTNLARLLVDPQLPRVFLDTRYIPPGGATINVPAGGDVQAALNAAQPGDEIVLAAGATFVGSFTLPNKPGTGWITIRSSTAAANLPTEGQRISPAYASVLPKLVSPDVGPALQTAPGAHHFRIVGVEITVAAGVTLNYGIVLLGQKSSVQTSLSQVPHDITLDRVYVHGTPTVSVSRCVALNGAATAVIDSYLSECHAQGFDAQAICGWNGPGPFKIVNTYLEGSGENMMFGGEDPGIQDLVPSDIEIRRNYFNKPLVWRGVWTAKNLLELKLGRRVLIQGNVFEHSWTDAQVGFAMLVWTVNQNLTAPWSVTEDVWIRENIIRHAAGGLDLRQSSGEGPSNDYTKRVRLDNNVWQDITSATWSSGSNNGRLFQIGSGALMHDVQIYTQTGIDVDQMTMEMMGGTVTNFAFSNNVVGYGLYGFRSDDAPDGTPTLDLHLPGWSFARNVIPTAPASRYPTNNFYPASTSAIGFVNAAAGDYHLAASSPYKNQGTNGRDPGADIDAVMAATTGVVP